MRPQYVRKNGKCAVLSGWLLAALMSFTASSALAEAPDWQEFYDRDLAQRAASIEVDEDIPWGIDRFDLDEHTEIIGWQISRSWYFGRQDGLDSGLTLVWQQSANQISLSKDGVRLTRRF